MRTLIAAFFMSGILAIPATGKAELENNALYQWETKNGTPTYSPEAPPKGVKYVVVGPDLKPLAQQPAQPSQDNNSVADASTRNTKSDTTPATVKKWKPIRYANAPATNGQPIVKTKRDVDATNTSEIAAPIVHESDECLTIKRDRLILESQFARAKTDEDMDNAILRLREKTSEYGQKCQ